MDRDAAKKIDDLENEVRDLKEEIIRLKKALGNGVEEMLVRRGFRIYRKERDKDVLKPGAQFKEEFYSLMGKYSFRLFLRDVIKYQDGFTPEGLSRFIGDEAAREFGQFLIKSGLAKELGDGRLSLSHGPVKSFGPTLEWYLAEVMRRELYADAVWGVNFREAGTGGDYDLLAALEGLLIYAEVKSSPPKQIYDTEIASFIDRTLKLSPHLSLFIVDTELRMKDKIVFMFEQTLPKSPLGAAPVVRWKDEIFRVGERIFIVNSKGGFIQNIKDVISAFLKERAWQAA
jgi:hypothetical protein